MLLFVRMALYFVFGALSGAGWLHWDAAAGAATVYVDELAPALIGIAGFAGTFAWSRIAKRRGGAT